MDRPTNVQGCRRDARLANLAMLFVTTLAAVLFALLIAAFMTTVLI
jgi:hypothetical protein